MAIEGLEQLAANPQFWQLTDSENPEATLFDNQNNALKELYGDKWDKYSFEDKNKILDYMANTWAPGAKSLGEQYAEKGRQIGGAVKKGAKQAFVENPSIGGAIIGGMVGGPLGAALGGMIGESVEIVNEALTGTEPKTIGPLTPPQVGQDENLPQSIGNQALYTLGRTGYAGVVEYLFEGTSRFIGKIIGGGFKGTAALAKAEKADNVFGQLKASEALDIYYFAKANGIDIPMPMFSDNHLVGTTYNMAANSFTGAGRAHRVLMQNVLGTGKMLDGMKKVMSEEALGGLPPNQAGALLADIAAGGERSAALLSEEMYKVLDSLNLSGQTVDLGPLYRKVVKDKKVLDAIAVKVGEPGGGWVDRFIDLVKTKGTKTGSTYSYGVSFSQAHRLRSELMVLRRAIAPLGNKQADKLLAEYIQTTHGLMKNTAEGLNADAFKAWRHADQFEKANHQQLFNKIGTKIITNVEKDPGAYEKLAKSVFETEDPNAVRNLFEMNRRATLMENEVLRQEGKPLLDLGAREKELASQYILHLFNKFSLDTSFDTSSSTVQGLAKNLEVPTSGIVDGGGILKYANDRNTKPIFDEVFKRSPIARANFIKSMKAIAAYTTREAGSGAMVIQLAQGGAVAALPSGKVAMRDVAGLFIAPWVASRLYHSTGWTKWFVEGLKVPAGSPRAVVIMARLAYYANKEGIPLMTPPSVEEAEMIMELKP